MRSRIDRGKAGQRVQDVARGGFRGIANGSHAHRRRTYQPDQQGEAVELCPRQPGCGRGDDVARDLRGRFT